MALPGQTATNTLGILQVWMPLPGERSAPKWSSKEKDIPEFIRSFEVAADQANLTNQNKWTQLGHYCKRPSDQELDNWKLTWF